MPRTVLIAVFMTVLWTITEAAEPAITCGATLGPDAAYALTADLTCPEATPALTLLRGVTLDLAGHILTAAGGIQLSGDEITILRGTIADCSAKGWCLFMSDEGHLDIFQDLVIAHGADITGDLMTVTCVLVGDPSLKLDGGQHRVDQVEVVATAGYITFGRGGSRLTRIRGHCATDPLPSLAFPGVDTKFPCVLLDGEKNLVVGMTITGGGVGFWLDGQQNLILGLTVTDTMLFDVKESLASPPSLGACTPNVWLFNTFATADPPCLLEWPHTVRAHPWLTPAQPQ